MSICLAGGIHKVLPLQMCLLNIFWQVFNFVNVFSAFFKPLPSRALLEPQIYCFIFFSFFLYFCSPAYWSASIYPVSPSSSVSNCSCKWFLAFNRTMVLQRAARGLRNSQLRLMNYGQVDWQWGGTRARTLQTFVLKCAHIC